jgi:protein-S-isoprenylcysteine O-methyltransferase Ste14
MFKLFWKYILKILDGTLYSFIGPFTVMYIIPQFLMKVVPIDHQDGFGIPAVETFGIVLMWSGAALAIWCTILMFLFGRGTPLVTSSPQEIMMRNVYGIVRHPMMWAIFIVVLGEIFTFGHFILIIWLIALIRIIHLIVTNYEEPQLERRFGENWKAYCEKVPRWIPKSGSE